MDHEQLAREELRDEFGQFTDSDPDETLDTVNRHKAALSEHDRRQSVSMIARSKEHESLRETVTRLLQELDMSKRQLAEEVRSRSSAEAKTHALELALLVRTQELETSHAQRLAQSVELDVITKQRDQLTQTLESRVAAQKRRQRAVRMFVEWAEEEDRRSIELGAIGAFDYFTIARNSLESMSRKASRTSSDAPMLEALERLRRADVVATEMRSAQTLVDQWNRLQHLLFDSFQPSARRQASRQPSPSRSHDFPRKASPVAGSRPWYPPGANATPHSPSRATPLSRRTRSPNASQAGASSPRRAPLASTMHNMQHLLTQLSTWADSRPV